MLVFFLLSSCIKEIKIKTNTIEKLPVVNCIFSPDSIFKVYVCLPTEISSNEPNYIDDAIIKIVSENNTVFNLYYTGRNGIYKSSQKPEINVQYRIEVDVPGYATVTANDKIPFPAAIEDIELYHDQDILNEGDSIPMSRITFIDDNDNDNYYDCIGFRYSDNNKKEYFNSPNYGNFNPDNVLTAENDIDFYPTSFFFSDELFNGNEYSLTVPIAAGQYYDGNIEFRTTSKNYYLFRKFWTRHYFYQNNDRNVGNGLSDIDFLNILNMSDPIEMFTNIENGYGIFAGYSCDVWLY